MTESSNPYMEASEALQEWLNAHPEHAEALLGQRHGITQDGQNTFDCGFNYFAAQLVAESFWGRTKDTAEHLSSVTIPVSPTRTGMPMLFVTVSRHPLASVFLAREESE